MRGWVVDGDKRRSGEENSYPKFNGSLVGRIDIWVVFPSEAPVCSLDVLSRGVY